MFEKEEFKRQLYEFIKFSPEPFDIYFLERNANVWVNRVFFYDILFELESEGKIISLSDGSYISVYAAMKKWIRERFCLIEIPYDLLWEVENFLREFCIQESVEQFFVTAIKKLIQEVKNCRS